MSTQGWWKIRGCLAGRLFYITQNRVTNSKPETWTPGIGSLPSMSANVLKNVFAPMQWKGNLSLKTSRDHHSGLICFHYNVGWTNVTMQATQNQLLGCCKSIEKCKKWDWIAFNSLSLNFYRTDSNAIVSIVFASLFDIIIAKSISFLSDETRRKIIVEKRLTFDVECWPSFLNHSYQVHAKQKWAKNVSSSPQMIAQLKACKHIGPNPSDMGDLRHCSNFWGKKMVRKQLKFESLKFEYFNFCVNCLSKSNKRLNGEKLLCCRYLIVFHMK